MTPHLFRLPLQVVPILLSALAMPARPLIAQDLVPDARVLVRQCPPPGVPGLCRRWQGAFQSLDGNSLTLRESSGVLNSVAWTPTTRVSVSRGRQSYVGHGAIIGLLLGAVVGKAAAESCGGDSERCGYEVPIGMGLGLGLGILGGAVAGTDRWVLVERPGSGGGLSRASVTVKLPTRTTAAGVGLRYQF